MYENTSAKLRRRQKRAQWLKRHFPNWQTWQWSQCCVSSSSSYRRRQLKTWCKACIIIIRNVYTFFILLFLHYQTKLFHVEQDKATTNNTHSYDIYKQKKLFLHCNSYKQETSLSQSIFEEELWACKCTATYFSFFNIFS